MQRTPVQSSSIASVGYDEATQTLEIEWTSGNTYQYDNVPPTVYRELMAASSIGRFVAGNIRNVYSARKIG